MFPKFLSLKWIQFNFISPDYIPDFLFQSEYYNENEICINMLPA